MTMPLRTTVMSTLRLYFPPKPPRRENPAAATLCHLLYLSTAKSQPVFSTLRSLPCPSATAAESESSSLLSISYAAKTIDPGYLSCSLPEKRPLKVAVLVSGGVDSSVALRLLHSAGHSCTAFYLKIWFQEDFENFWSECPWEEDLKYARSVCDQVEVPLEVVHLTDEYWNNVVSYIIDEYRHGRTPNPDVLCNTRIKFGAFVDAIGGMNFDFIASGHYAKVVHPDNGNKDEPSTLELSKDMVKDQTYFLSHLSQSQLKGLIFPLGCMRKEEVRRLAKIFELPNQDRKDSQGICFLGKIKFSEFVARHIGVEEGVILEAETGDFLGTHQGFWFYTIGQRQGLCLPGGPWYVVKKDVQNNVVFVSRNYFSVDKRRRIFRVGSLRWFNGSPPSQITQLKCKDDEDYSILECSTDSGKTDVEIYENELMSFKGQEMKGSSCNDVRHGPGFYSCDLAMEVDGNGHEIAVVELSEDDQGLAAGQFAAFYQESTCIGSGVILESWDNQGFPVCVQALEIAKMKDKSKLGKPVKIKVRPQSTKEEECDRKECEAKLNLTSVYCETAAFNERKVSQGVTRSSNPLKWLKQFLEKFSQVS